MFDKLPHFICRPRHEQEMFASCESDDVDVQDGLIHAGVNVNYQNESGHTAQYLACRCNSFEVCKLQLQSKADPCISGKDGELPLHAACSRGNIALVKLLLEYNSEVNAHTLQRGYTPQWMSARDGHMEICKMLLHHQATPNPESKEESPLFTACVYGHHSIARQQQEHQADATYISLYGLNSCLHIAASSHDIELCQLLIAQNCPVMHYNHRKESALFTACRVNAKNVICLLLQCNARVNDINDTQDTPLQLAQTHVREEHSDPSVVALLLESKAQPMPYGKTGKISILLQLVKQKLSFAVDLQLRLGGVPSTAELKVCVDSTSCGYVLSVLWFYGAILTQEVLLRLVIERKIDALQCIQEGMSRKTNRRVKIDVQKKSTMSSVLHYIVSTTILSDIDSVHALELVLAILSYDYT